MEKSQLESVLNLKIKEMKTSPGAPPGAGVAGTLLSFDVTTADNKKLHLVHKGISQDNPMQKQFTIKNQSFHVEASFYTKLVPALDAFAKSKGSKSETVIHVPKYYGGLINNDTDYLLLEDLRADGFKMCDKHVGFNLDETSCILKELAGYHATTYAFLRWEGEKVFEHPDFKIFGRNFFDDPEMKAMGGPMFNGAFAISTNLVAARNPELAEKMRMYDASFNTLEQMHETAFKTDKEFFPVIMLGDAWLNNIMVKHDAAGKVQQVKFIDFQLTRRGNIFEELQYFIFTSTTPVFRAAYLTQVLELYYNTFVKTLELLQCPLPVGFTKGFLLDNFAKCYRAIYKYMSFAIPLQLAEPLDMAKLGGGGGGDDSGKNEQGQGPPATEHGPPNGVMPDMDPAQMLAFQVKMFTEGMRASMEASPKAVQRMYDISEEMEKLKII